MTESTRLEQLAREHFEAAYQAMPPLATILGVHRYDAELGDFSRAAMGDHLARLKDFLARLRRIDRGALALAESVDWRLLESDLLTSITNLETIPEWRRNPAFYVDWPLYGMLVLLTRSFAPPAERLRSLAGRLRALRGVLDAARQNLENPPRVFTEVAIETVEGAIAFLDETVPAAAREAPEVEADVLAARQEALDACASYLDFLRTDLLPRSGGDFAIGRQAFEEKLRVEHMLDLSVDEVMAAGRRIFDETRLALETLAAEIDPSKPWPVLVEEGRSQHPAADDLLDAYRREMARLRAFIVDRDLVSIPGNEVLDVVETPAFARSTTPYAAYMPPAPFESEQRGQFWVTPVDTTLPTADQEANLAEHSYSAIPGTALHEAYPGHHLQLVASDNVSDYVRKHVASNLFCEGWALYCEQLLGEQGYVPAGAADGDGRLFRLFILKDQLWRAARILIDVGLHTQGMTVDAAVRLLVDEVKLAEGPARVEVNRYTSTPTQPLSYTFGKLEILRLRDDFRGLPLREFHDRLLASGTIPLTLVREEMAARR